MSKKKFTNGSTTMTLKDFHGGSIPSDLLLPSAPGISVKVPDRPSAWISAPTPTGPSSGARVDSHRPRPGSSGGLPRVIDERGPGFLSSSFIGRHFDEDERKPFEASSAPRRPSAVASEPANSPPVTPAETSAALDPKRAVFSSVALHLSPSPGVSTSSSGNAWAARKEASLKGSGVAERPQADPSITLSGPSAASRFAQASAIEKVSSGRWQSKPPNVEVVRFEEVELLDGKPEDRDRARNDEEGNVGRALLYSGVKERKLGGLPSDGLQQGRVTPPLYPETKKINSFGSYSDCSRPVSHERILSSSSHQHTVDEASERPKLKLLPRTKPLEPSDAKILEGKQGQLYPASLKRVEENQEMYGVVSKMKPVPIGNDVVNRPTERPKLNLKPRSQPLELQDEIFERERKTIFGGARPREFVLKERDMDATDNPEITAQSHRAKSDVPKIEPKVESAATFSRAITERSESSLAERRSSRDAERRDNRPVHATDDTSRNSRRNDNWRNPREMEKKPVEVERHPEPATWRKPVEPPKPETPPGPRVVKASSALELAQAFSRSMSDSKVDNHHTKQRMLPGRTQMPFSRLTDAREIYSGPAHRHINGY